MAKPIDEMTAHEFDEYFDNGGDISELFDSAEGELLRPSRNDAPRAINTTLPEWLVEFLDDEASRRGVSRKAVINSWLVDRADEEMSRRMTA